MLGYMTKKQALKNGYTHHGSYYGIPLWMGDLNTDCPMVSAKFEPLEWFVMPLVTFIEQLVNDYRGHENMFMFKVIKEIK